MYGWWWLQVFGCDRLFGLMLIVLVVLVLGDECVSFVVLLLITCCLIVYDRCLLRLVGCTCFLFCVGFVCVCGFGLVVARCCS